MSAIKSIKYGDTIYDIKATYDASGNIIDLVYAKTETIPTKLSDLQNDNEYLTKSDISDLQTEEQVKNLILEVVGTAPEALDTLQEIASALDNDAEFSETIKKLIQTNSENIIKKVDKVEGKQLSTEDYTSIEKTKLSGIAENAQVNVLSDWGATEGDSFIKNKPTLGTLSSKDVITKSLLDSSLQSSIDLANSAIQAETDPTVPSWAKAETKPSYTKSEIGLSNVDNTSDLDKPVSNATQTALNNKVDKVEGKLLSTEDYTSTEKTKLSEIEEKANNYVHPTTSGNKHIPSGGEDGQMLVFDSDGTAKWSDSSSKLDAQFELLNSMWESLQTAQKNLDLQVTELNNNIDLYSYGVEWDITVASPILTRIGNPLLHKSLPIQSAYRGCVCTGSTINYYLNADDWAYKEDGVTPSVLDGTDGTVRVHTPKFYGKSGSNGNKRWVRISTVQIDTTWVTIPELVVDAYRCTIDKTNSSLYKTASVVNNTTNFRGGGDRSAYDTYLTSEDETIQDLFKSDLCKPRTNITRAVMRTYAKNADSELLCYEFYKWIFYWCYTIEYANLNSQADFNAELTSDGYRLGGLGSGVTTLSSSTWSSYNGCYPLTPCGYGNSIGNGTGLIELTISSISTTFKVPRWRGFDNPFGDIWTNLDGIILYRSAANTASMVYTTTDVNEFTDVIGNKTIAGYEIASDGYTTQFDLGETGEIIPSAVGGSSTTYMCDYHWCNASVTSLRTLLVGGCVDYGAYCGFAYFTSYDGAVGYANARVGFRTLSRISA